MAIRIPWSLTESVILLDALIAYLDGKITSKSLIAEVSSFLRKCAVYRGIEIDDKFRNENGIAMQFRVMEYFFTGGKHGLKKDQCPKIFQEAIDLYHQDRKDFERVLQEAKAMDKYDHVDFMNLQDYVYTKPYEYIYAGETIQVSSWRMLYMSVVKCLLRDHPDKILSLKNGSITRSGAIDICDNKSVYRLRTAGKLGNNLYIEVNLSAKNIAQRIIYLLDMCHVPYSDLVIRLKKNDPNAPKEQIKPEKKKVTAVGSSPVDRPVPTPAPKKYLPAWDRCMLPMSDSERILTNTAKVQRNLFLCA